MSETLWECPKCGRQIRNKFAKEVNHNCKTAKKIVNFKVVQEEHE